MTPEDVIEKIKMRIKTSEAPVIHSFGLSVETDGIARITKEGG